MLETTQPNGTPRWHSTKEYHEELNTIVKAVDVIVPQKRLFKCDDVELSMGTNKSLRFTYDEQDDRLVVYDLTHQDGDHSVELPSLAANANADQYAYEFEDGDSLIFGRAHNPRQIELLDNLYVSRKHFEVIPRRLGNSAISLAITDFSHVKNPIDVKQIEVYGHSRLFAN